MKSSNHGHWGFRILTDGGTPPSFPPMPSYIVGLKSLFLPANNPLRFCPIPEGIYIYQLKGGKQNKWEH